MKPFTVTYPAFNGDCITIEVTESEFRIIAECMTDMTYRWMPASLLTEQGTGLRTGLISEAVEKLILNRTMVVQPYDGQMIKETLLAIHVNNNVDDALDGDPK